MNLGFVNQTTQRVPRKYLTQFVCQVYKVLKKKKIGGEFYKKELILAFLSKKEIKKINFQFRKTNRPTDVLSFSGLGEESFGDLLFCPEIIVEQARDHGLAYRDELAYMVLHGILHLLGFEHEEGGPQAKEMFDLQDEIFEKLIL